jgi:hypothetical protein
MTTKKVQAEIEERKNRYGDAKLIRCRDLERRIYWTAILTLLAVNASARCEENTTALPGRVQGLFLPSLTETGPRSSCADRKAVCENPCKQWANGQPDFQYSYGHCVQTCSEQAAFCR